MSFSGGGGDGGSSTDVGGNEREGEMRHSGTLWRKQAKQLQSCREQKRRQKKVTVVVVVMVMVTTLTVQRMRVMQGKDWTLCAGQVYEANHVMEREREMERN